MKKYWSDEIEIDYKNYVKLHNEGKCNLGLPNFDAAAMTYNSSYLPRGSGIAGTHMIFTLISWSILGFSIYLSFTLYWWVFIPGIFIFKGMYDSVKKSNVLNICNEALINEDFYNKLKLNKSTMYQMEENDAKEFLK